MLIDSGCVDKKIRVVHRMIPSINGVEVFNSSIIDLHKVFESSDFAVLKADFAQNFIEVLGESENKMMMS
jgi:hypothetical protein